MTLRGRPVRQDTRLGVFGRHDPYPFDYIVWHTFYEEKWGGKLSTCNGRGITRRHPSRHIAEDWRQYSLSREF